MWNNRLPIILGSGQGLYSEGLHIHIVGEGEAGGMAGDWRRGPDAVEPVHSGEEEHHTLEEGPGTHVKGGNGAAEEEEVEGILYRGERVRLSITARRVRINPDRKRHSYIKRLEKVMRQCDGLVADPSGYEEIQVKAMNVLIRAIQVCYGIVLDIEVETLEEEIEELKRRETQLKEATDQDTGYEAEATS